MIRAFLLFSFLLVGQRVVAAEIIVRAGEHGDFTRVVLSMPRPAAAEVSGTKPIRITLDRRSYRFNLSEASARLNAGRIVGFRHTNARALEIETNCDCSVESYVAGGNLLVLDIRGSVEKEIGIVVDAPPELKLPLVQSATESGGSAFTIAEQVTSLEPRVERHGQLKQELAQAISKGIGTGLLNIKVEDANVLVTHKKDIKPIRARGSKTPDLSSHIRTMSAADVAPGNEQENMGPNKHCQSDHVLTFKSAPEEAQIFAQVASLRTQLFREFDRLDEKRVASLAKLYIASGLGVEAMEILRLLGVPDPSLSVLAQVVEGESEPTSLPDGWSTNCNNVIALWSYLIEPSLIEHASLNEDALLSGFNAFPKILKQQLGPKLARQLLGDGFEETAGEVLRFSRRGRKDISDAEAIAHAQFLTKKGMYADSSEALRLVMQANTEDAVSATIELVGLAVKRDQAVPAESVELLEAFYAERRDSSRSNLIISTLAKAYANNEQFGKSVKTLETLSQGSATKLMEDSVGYVFERLSKDANDSDFLSVAFGEFAYAAALRRREKMMMVERLLDLGFAERAIGYLETSPQSNWGEEERMLMAKGYAALGQTSLALEALPKVESPDAIELRKDIENTIHAASARGASARIIPDGQTPFVELSFAQGGSALSLEVATAKLEKSKQLRQTISTAVGQPVTFSE